jgi:hypothetical protein
MHSGIMEGYKTVAERFGKNWSPEEERTLLDTYRMHGPNWGIIEATLPLRKGIVSKWKRLVATGARARTRAPRPRARNALTPPPPALPPQAARRPLTCSATGGSSATARRPRSPRRRRSPPPR